MPNAKIVNRKAKAKQFLPSSVYAARIKVAEQFDLPVMAVRLVLPGGRPQLALGSMGLDELRTRWRKWPQGK